jgi:hypothetical protein
MGCIGGMDLKLHTFQTLELDGGEQLASHIRRLTPFLQERAPISYFIGGCLAQSQSGFPGTDKNPYACVNRSPGIHPVDSCFTD